MKVCGSVCDKCAGFAAYCGSSLASFSIVSSHLCRALSPCHHNIQRIFSLSYVLYPPTYLSVCSHSHALAFLRSDYNTPPANFAKTNKATNMTLGISMDVGIRDAALAGKNLLV